MSVWVYGDLLTGRILGTLPVEDGTWVTRLNEHDDIQCSVSTADPDVQSLNLKTNLLVGKSFVAVLEGNNVLASGIVWSHSYDQANRKLIVNAYGILSYFAHRLVLPNTVQNLNSVASYDTSYSNVSYGTMATYLVQQALSWAGANLPIDLPNGWTDSGKTLSVLGSELATVADRLKQLTELSGGPDIVFRPYLDGTNLYVRWAMLTGTPQDPYVYSYDVKTWTVGVPESTVKTVNILTDGSQLASYGYATGGSASGVSLMYKSNNTTLLTKGYPVFDLVDSAHATATTQAQVQAYADNIALQGVAPYETWNMEVLAYQSPTVDTYNVGDFINVNIVRDDFIPAGIYNQRIVMISGDAQSKYVKIDCVPKR